MQSIGNAARDDQTASLIHSDVVVWFETLRAPDSTISRAD